jgi:hypothetical protein
MEPHETAMEARKERKKWKAKRDRLFDKYLKDPSNTSLALEIKALDDQVAKSNEREAARLPTRP